jgi:3'-phosphoadenosine 5'-phosphosulfate sulfotransferase (PAPS reductase)/FAD synthetase
VITARLFGEQTVVEAIDETRAIVERAKAQYQPAHTLALFSGGNDSATMLDIVRDQVDAAVHIVTGIGIPETSVFVRETCERWAVPLIELRTDPGVYRDIVLGPTRQGFPGPGFHYITYHRLKSQRLQELQRDYAKGRGTRILLVSGVRSSESARRMRQIGGTEIDGPRGRLGKVAWANPIVHFDALAMNAARDLLGTPRSPVADALHKSGECLCGCFACPGELDELAFWYPDTAAYIRELESEAERLGKRYSKWGGPKESRMNRRIPGPLCSGCVLFEAEVPQFLATVNDSSATEEA